MLRKKEISQKASFSPMSRTLRFIRIIEKSQDFSSVMLDESIYGNGRIDWDILILCTRKHSKSLYGEHLVKVAEGRIIARDGKGY